MTNTVDIRPGTMLNSIEDLSEVTDLSILLDNRWDLWRVTDGGRATLHGGHRAVLSVPWDLAVRGQAGIFPFQVLWTPQTSTI